LISTVLGMKLKIGKLLKNFEFIKYELE
jgi:hypothetical protein